MHTNFQYFFISSLIFMLLFACENEETLIGENFLNTGNYEVFILEDSLISINSTSTQEGGITQSESQIISLLGGYEDPVFGHSEASFSFEVGLPNNDMNFNASSVQSAKITLPYIGYYGDSIAEFRINISQLTDNINYEIASNDTISSNTVYSNSENISLLDIKDNGFLELEIPNDFIYNNILNLPNQQLTNDSTFKSNFKGLKLTSQTVNSGAIMYFNVTSEDAFINVKYTDNEMQNQEINLPINGVKVNSFQLEDNNDIEAIDSLIFLQSMGGFISQIDLSFLNNFSDSGYAVNEALLSLDIHNNNNDFDLPDKILFTDSNNSEISGGLLNAENKTYEVNITQEVQKIITHSNSPIINLYPIQRSQNAERLILSNTVDNPIRLKLVLIKD